jgi:aminopeptidase N
MLRIKYAFFLAAFFSLSISFAQTFQSGSADPLFWKNRKPDAEYWQQDVHYNINAKIDEVQHVIEAGEQLTYTNNSPDTLRVLYFHLFQNAFVKGSYLHRLEERKGQKPKLGKQEAAGNGTEVTKIVIDGQPVIPTIDNTIMQIALPTPLLPGKQLNIVMKFRTWYDKDGSTRRRMKMYDAWGAMHYNGVQWFPKICVYDRKFGWDTYQHLNKEFYGDFGTFDVSLDFASNYVVEATGMLTNKNEVLPEELRKKLDIKNFADKKWDEKPSIITPYKAGERKVWKYHAEGVHDFAFTADPSYRLGDTTWKGIQCVAIVQEPHASGWQNAPQLIADILRTLSEGFGQYAYPKMVAADAADGMEYPMITLDGGKEPGYRGLFMHEIGHNWFYGMVGSNETYRAAMDEGFTQFATGWGLRKLDGDTMKADPPATRWERKFAEPALTLDRNVLNGYTMDALYGTEVPINTHSNDFHDALAHEGGYRQVYFKTASMLYNLQYVLGDSLFQAAMRHYFDQWKFAHPYFEDFRSSIIRFTKVDLNWFFDEWFETTKTIDYSINSVSRVKGSDGQWKIRFRRRGLSQMPVDFTVTDTKGNKQSYTIPNTWFDKPGANNLPKWYGWSKIDPVYDAHVRVPGKIASVQIDTSYRLADIDYTNNFYNLKLFGPNPAYRTRFDAGLARPTDRRSYRGWVRPDVWWNAVDGVKLGVHFEGDYLGLLDKIDGSVWWNTHALQGYGYDQHRPFSYTLNLATPLSKQLPNLIAELSLRDLDGMQYSRMGATYKAASNKRIGLHWQTMQRRYPEEYDYLILPTEWSSTQGRVNSFLDLDAHVDYSQNKMYGFVHFLARLPFLSGNETNSFDYSFVQVEGVNNAKLGKLELRSRVFARFGTGTQLPYESALFAAGANPEQMMEDKYTRSVGFIPGDWEGMSRYEPSNFQAGGGLNLRGYSGYFMPDTRDGEELVGYKGRSGASVNAELDFDGLFKLKPKYTKNWLHLDAYLFGDAGLMELSHYDANNFTIIHPTEMWSDVHVDAGLGFAATIKKFGPLAQARPLTIRVDLPFFLNRPSYSNPQYWDLRYVVGVSRTF